MLPLFKKTAVGYHCGSITSRKQKRIVAYRWSIVADLPSREFNCPDISPILAEVPEPPLDPGTEFSLLGAERTEQLRLELIRQTNRCAGSARLVGCLLLECRVLVAGAAPAGVEVLGVLARADRNLGDDVLVLALPGGRAYITDVAGSCLTDSLTKLSL